MFSLDDYSDREVMHLINDLGGVVTAERLALKVGLDVNDSFVVSIRLSWMRRFGMVEKVDREHGKQRWALSDEGEKTVRAGATTTAAQAAMPLLDDGELLWAAHTLAGRYQKTDAPYAEMVRREWQREIRKKRSRA